MKRFITIVLCIAMLFSCASLVASAASASMSGSLSGKTATFKLTVSDSNGVGGIQGTLTCTGGKITSVSGNGAKINGSDFIAYVDDSLNKFTITIKCDVTGDSITLKASNVKVVNEDGDKIGTVSASKTLKKPTTTTTTTKPTTTASTAANLKSLSVAGQSLNEKFSGGRTSYTVTVPEGTTSANISAVPVDSAAKVSGTGTVNFNSLPYTTRITVTAPNGEKKTYSVTFKVKEVVTTAAPEAANLSDLSVSTLCNMEPAFSPSVTDYTATVPAGTNSVSVKAILDKVTYPGATVTVAGADDLKGAGNVVTVTVTSKDGIDVVYKINIKYAGEVTVAPVSQPTEEGGHGMPVILALILMLILFILGFVLGFIVGKKKNKNDSGPYNTPNYPQNDINFEVDNNQDTFFDGPMDLPYEVGHDFGQSADD